MTDLSPGDRVLVLGTTRDGFTVTVSDTAPDGSPCDIRVCPAPSDVYPAEPVLALIEAVLDMDHARDCRVYGVKADSERNCNCAKRALSDPTITALVKALGQPVDA